VALNEEKANMDILTNRAGNLNKKKFAQESIQLRQQLEKKTHDLQAIIWKMNELHLINKTYNEKMSNREQHVTYLEENLVELQSSNRNMIMERQEAEDKLREELENLKVLVDAMTIPLWQFGECGVTGRTLASRIRLPVRGGDYAEENGQNADGHGSMESLEQSEVSEEDEEEEEDESVELETPEQSPVRAPLTVQQVQIIQQSNVSMRDVSTQTLIASQEKGTMTDAAAMPQTATTIPPRDPNLIGKSTTYANAVKTKEVAQIYASDGDSVSSASHTAPPAPQSDTVPTPNNRRRSVEKDLPPPPQGAAPQSTDDLFRGGKSSSSQPRRFVHKFGLMIRPGVLKESSSSSKPKESSSRTKS
jgi:PAS domain-containing protein